MAKDHPQARIKDVQVHAGVSLHHQPHQQAGKDRLQEVPHKYQEARLFPHDPQRIGGAGIAAAILSDIDMVHFSIEISGLKQAEHIPRQKT